MRLLLLLSYLLASGCTASSADPSSWRLDDGTPLGAFAAEAPGSVVLVMDPGECFTCSGTLAEWLEWRRQNPDRFSLVFTRRPSASEKRRLASVRLPIDGYLASRPSVPTPVELLVENGRVVHQEHGVVTPLHSALLPHLRHRTFDEVASVLRRSHHDPHLQGGPR